MLYGLHLARPAIAKQDRAIVVEGNTDVIALRQAGVEPVVASMGTALTESQLRELGRLTKRLFLCFDADAAGQEATLRGMELAVRPGLRRARRRAAEGRGSRRCAGLVRGSPRRGRELRPLPRAHRARAHGRPPGGVRARARDPRPRRGFAGAPGRAPPARRPARPAARDARGPCVRAAAGRAAHAARSTTRRHACSEAGLQRERDLLAAVVRNPSLVPELAALTPDHFDDPVHRRFREALVSRRRRRTRSSSRCAPSSVLGPSGTRSTSGRAASSSCACTSRSCGASSSRAAPTSCGRRRSRRSLRRCARRSPSSADGASGVSSCAAVSVAL